MPSWKPFAGKGGGGAGRELPLTTLNKLQRLVGPYSAAGTQPVEAFLGDLSAVWVPLESGHVLHLMRMACFGEVYTFPVDGEDADVVWPMHDVAGDNPNHRRRAVVRAPNRRRHVKLSHEEAFFLVADARVLRVRSDAPWPNEIPGQTPNPNKAYFDTEALWRVLCSTSDAEAFACHYVAYRHYRSKGYIPRSGLTFGADWILYGAHPSAAHSEFSVLVIPVVTDGKTGERTTRAPWHWRDVQSLVRLSTAVSKKVVALYVHHDAGVLLESVAADAPAANDADGSAAEPDAKRRRVEAPPPKGVLDFLATVSTTEVRLQRWTTALMERESRAQAARNAAAAAIAAVDAK